MEREKEKKNEREGLGRGTKCEHRSPFPNTNQLFDCSMAEWFCSLRHLLQLISSLSLSGNQASDFVQ